MANKKYIDLYKCREDFYNDVLIILSDDTTNDRANEIIDVFDSLPAADVQEVVRCKDCEYRKTEDCAMQYECECGAHYFWDSDNAFCSRGRRMDGDKE